MRSKRVVGWTVTGVVVFLLGVVAVEGEWIPGPKPSFPVGSGVRTYVNQDSLPPQYEAGIAVTAGPIRRDTADFWVFVEDGEDVYGTLRVGETAELGVVTIALCDTWVNKWAYLWPQGSGSTRKDASRAYYVQSTDGSTPTCP